MRKGLLKGLLLALWLMFISSASAEQVRIATASNFTAPMRVLAHRFEQISEHSTKLSFSSSGKLYAQIAHGAPYDVFFSADRSKPLRLSREGLADGQSQFTYAVGVLALWSNAPDTSAKVQLSKAQFNRLAVANPRLAPFGIAAIQVIDALGLDHAMVGRLVKGDNVAQVYQFVHSGNADMGFVALSQVIASGQNRQTIWVVPAHLHQPIYQDAVVLDRARNNAAALAFVDYVRSTEARKVIAEFGYTFEQAPYSLSVRQP